MQPGKISSGITAPVAEGIFPRMPTPQAVGGSVMSPLIDELRDRLLEWHIRDTALLVAVSGGPDSVALLRGLFELQTELGLSLTVGHFNHGYRGAASDADAAWVTALAERWTLPVVVGTAGSSVRELREASAREERYRFLEQMACDRKLSCVVTAHSRMDQVETILHHLLRGTGVAGLQGIPAQRAAGDVRVIRPLLNVSRAEILQFLEDQQQDYRVDHTNAETRLTRNWIRHELLPLIHTRFPQADEAVLRLARQAGDAAEIVREAGQTLLAACLRGQSSSQVELTVVPCRKQRRAVIREACVLLWRAQGWPLREMSFDRWEELADLILADSGAATFPGGIAARRRRDLLILHTTTGGQVAGRLDL